MIPYGKRRDIRYLSPVLSFDLFCPTITSTSYNMSPFLFSIATIALSTIGQLAQAGAPASCAVTGSTPQSCQNTTKVTDTCCFNAPGGQLLQTQVWLSTQLYRNSKAHEASSGTPTQRLGRPTPGLSTASGEIYSHSADP